MGLRFAVVPVGDVDFVDDENQLLLRVPDSLEVLAPSGRLACEVPTDPRTPEEHVDDTGGMCTYLEGDLDAEDLEIADED